VLATAIPRGASDVTGSSDRRAVRPNRDGIRARKREWSGPRIAAAVGPLCAAQRLLGDALAPHSA